MIIAWCEVYGSRSHRLLVLRFPHGQRALSRENLGKLARFVPRKVQHDEQSRPRLGRQRGKQDRERFHSAGGRADDDCLYSFVEWHEPHHEAARFWKILSSRAKSLKAPACEENRNDSFEPIPRNPLRQSASLNSPSARSCRVR